MKREKNFNDLDNDNDEMEESESKDLNSHMKVQTQKNNNNITQSNKTTLSKVNPTLFSAKSLNCKNDILKVLKTEIEEYNKRLQFFFIQKENFSMATKIAIEEFAELIKYNEEIFTLYEKEKLMFVSSSGQQDNYSKVMVGLDDIIPVKVNNKPMLDILKSTLELVSLKLASLKRNLETIFINENGNVKNNSLDGRELISVIENIDKVISTSSKQIKKVETEKIENAKNLLKEIKEIQMEKELRLNTLKLKEKELAYYENLPKNCEDLSLLIDIKQKEVEKIASTSRQTLK